VPTLDALDAEPPPNTRERCPVAAIHRRLATYPVETEVFNRWLSAKKPNGQYVRTALWICERIQLRTQVPIGTDAVKRHRRGECKCA
jgi:hypothetical protein